MQVQAIDILRRVEKTLSIHFGLLSRLRAFPANWQQINKEQSKSAKTWEIWLFKKKKKQLSTTTKHHKAYKETETHEGKKKRKEIGRN